MKKLDKKILSDIYKSADGLYAYTFYKRYQIKPNEIFLFIQKYQEMGIVLYEGDRLTLTPKGKEIILKKGLQHEKASSRFSRIPDQFIDVRIKKNEFYLPDQWSLLGEI